MKEKALTVEFRLPPTGTSPSPKPLSTPPGMKAERQRIDRAARRARSLALAYWIDGLVRSGSVADLAEVARLGHVSRSRVSQVVGMLSMEVAKQENLLYTRTSGPRLPTSTA